jgi:hypothetical protein
MRNVRSAFVLGLLLLIVPVAQAASFIVEDFESQTVGAFPSGWLDVGQIDPASTAPNPSAVVVSTTDAFGNPTQALSIPDAFAASQGIYQTIPTSPFVNISADVRVDRFSAPSTRNTADWPIDITLSKLDGTTDLAHVNSMGVYAASLSETWNGYIVTDNVFYDPDFGVPVGLGTWYRVELGLDTANGIMTTLITDIALGSVVVDRTDVVPGWTAADGVFDAVSFFDGELTSDENTNLALIDNIQVRAVPEPSGMWLLTAGLALALWNRRKRKS